MCRVVDGVGLEVWSWDFLDRMIKRLIYTAVQKCNILEKHTFSGRKKSDTKEKKIDLYL